MAETSRPKHFLHHQENRVKVCAPCGKNISVKQIRKVSDTEVSHIVDLINVNYDVNNPVFPTGICNTCRNILRTAKKTGNLSKLPVMLNYEDLVLQRNTRSDDTTEQKCNCNICLTARSHAKCKRMIGDKVEKNTGLYGSSELVDQLPNKTPPKKKRSSLTICSICKQEIGSGINHHCSMSQSSDHIVEHVLTLPDKQQDQIITALIKTKANHAETNSRVNASVTLSTKGSKARVLLNPAPQETKLQFSSESLDSLQMNLDNISNKHMKKIANYLRVQGGRQIVEPGYSNHVTLKGKVLENLYSLSYSTFDVKDGVEKRPIVYADAESVVSAVIDARGYLGSASVKVMADGGQGFLKICVTVLPENYNPIVDRGCSEEENIDPIPEEVDRIKRSTYKECKSSDNNKLTSVKKVILLAIVPNCKETHSNMKTLFDLTNLNNISFLFVTDMKLLLTCIGCQTATSSFPCPYCLSHYSDIAPDNEDDPVTDVVDEIEDRTFGKLIEDSTKFVEIYGSKKLLAKHCNSTVNSPLLKESAAVKVIDKCPPEEMHLMMGFVNHTFFNGLVKVLGRETALKFPKSLNLISQDYHGEVFEGNACREMLKKAQCIEKAEVLGLISPIIVQPYICAYQAMDKLVHACFGMKLVDKSKTVDLIKELIISYMDLDISVTPKLHVIFYHILPSLQNPVLQGRGLGVVSGQAGE